MPTKKRTKGAHGTLGPSVQVTYRIPKDLYDRIMKIAESMYQSAPVVLRAAAAEYVKNHRPVRHRNTGITLKWDDVQETIHTPLAEQHVTHPDTPLTDDSVDLNPELEEVCHAPSKEGGV